MKTNLKPVNVLTMNPDTDVLTEEEVKTNRQQDLIVYNDDVSTFDAVQIALQDICDHTIEQSVQCSMIIHNNGKCSVKRGSFKKLQPLCYALLGRKLSATIE